MKVVLVNDQLNAGGAERVLVNIANLLHKNKIEVSVVMFLKPSALDHEINHNIKITYLNRKWRFDYAAMRTLKKQLKDADIIHVHSRYNLRYYMVAKLLTFAPSKPIVFHEHVPDHKKIGAFTSFLFKRLNAYVGVQERLCTWVKDKKLVAPKNVFFLPNVVARPGQIKLDNLHEEKRIVMVANFRRIKNQLLALQILQALGSDYTLDLYGMIDEADYYEELTQYVKVNELEHRVNIKTGITNMYEYLPRYQFALHTATNETGPLVLLEYMNSGLPFLTYKTGDVVSNVNAALPQFVMDTLTVADWVDRIKVVLSDPRARPKLQQEMEQLINERYSEETYFNTLDSIYKKTIAV
jgi:glycosyltransferase involved in cell wall biosynthesis